MNDQFTKLHLELEYNKHKGDECREILLGLYTWDGMPDSALTFTIGNVKVASFQFGSAEMEFLTASFMHLASYYRNKQREVQTELEILMRLDKEKAASTG